MTTRHTHSRDRSQELLHHPQLLSPCRTVRVPGPLPRTTAAIAIAGSIAFAAQTAAAADIGPFMPQMNFTNPLEHATAIGAAPSFADLDADGDLDAVLTDFDTQQLHYFENTGADKATYFTPRTGTDNPFATITGDRLMGIVSPVSLADIDTDGDLDLVFTTTTTDPISSEKTSQVRCYLNSGSPSNPVFAEPQAGASNPFGSIDASALTGQNCMGDIDGDMQPDLLVIGKATNEKSEEIAALRFFSNTGDGTYGLPLKLPQTTNFWMDMPTLVDFDGDGDLDVLGIIKQTIQVIENTGDRTHPVFQEEPKPVESSPSFHNSFGLMDMDGDGDLDLFISNYLISGMVCYKNIGDENTPEFIAQENPFQFSPDSGNGLTLASLALADIDGDGDLDAVVSNYYGSVDLYTNTGSSPEPRYEKTESELFSNLTNQGVFSVEFADLNGDGNLELIAGRQGDTLYRYEAGPTPSYVPVSKEANPLDGIDFQDSALADLDSDGDLDLIAADPMGSGSMTYYRNDGSVSSPVFTPQTELLSSLGNTGIMPAFCDLDDDGDYDLVLGDGYGQATHGLEYAENIGTPTHPEFKLRSGSENPFGQLPSGMLTQCTLVDMDGDGKQDLFTTRMGHPITYYHNGAIEDPEIPVDDTDESYGSCFIGSSHASSRSNGKTVVAMALAGLASVGSSLLKRKKGQKP